MQLGVLAVQRDEQRIREAAALVHYLGLHALERGQVAVLFRGGVYGVDAPVLVAALVLEVDDVPTVLGPEVHPDAALPIVGDRLEVVPADLGTDRADPDVQDAVSRGEVGEALSVGGEAGRYPLRVAEEGFARDQGHAGGRGFGHVSLFLAVFAVSVARARDRRRGVGRRTLSDRSRKLPRTRRT